MTIRSTPRRGGDRPRHVHFAYTATDRGGKWEAWTAGSTIWLWVHCSWKSKPCVAELTGGELVCEFCTRRQIPVVKGYVPLYRCSDAKPVCVIVDEACRDHLEALPHHTRVYVARERTRGSYVTVTRALSQEPAYQSTLPERKIAADITDSLLRMWQMPELIDWHARTQQISDSAVTVPDDASTRPLTSIERALRRQAEASKPNSDTPVSLAEALAHHRRYGHLDRPSVNGDEKGGE